MIYFSCSVSFTRTPLPLRTAVANNVWQPIKILPQAITVSSHSQAGSPLSHQRRGKPVSTHTHVHAVCVVHRAYVRMIHARLFRTWQHPSESAGKRTGGVAARRGTLHHTPGAKTEKRAVWSPRLSTSLQTSFVFVTEKHRLKNSAGWNSPFGMESHLTRSRLFPPKVDRERKLRWFHCQQRCLAMLANASSSGYGVEIYWKS